MIGSSVMCNYGNSRIFKIDDIDLQKSPFNEFIELKKTGEKISLAEYYHRAYGITIKEKN